MRELENFDKAIQLDPNDAEPYGMRGMALLEGVKDNISLDELILNNKKIGVSACLAGKICRYDGKYAGNKTIEKFIKKNDVFTFCPEIQGGLPTPREQAEIQDGDGVDVWNNKSNVLTLNGKDVTEAFKKGACNALKMLQNKNISTVILKEGSPSCGCSIIYDGTFSGVKKNGAGVATALFRQNKILVYSDKGLNVQEKRGKSVF